MPFSPTTIQPPTAAAKVTVTFNGLMLLKPIPGNKLEVGINRFSPVHAFQAVLIIRKPTRPPVMIRLINGPLTRPLTINVIPRPAAGVQTFEATPGPFVRSAPTNNEFDFRWAIDMCSLHPGADYNDGAQPVATLDGGVLYTPTLTRPTLNPVLVQGTTTITDSIPLFRFSADLAASIDGPGTRVKLIWHELGEQRTYSVPRPLGVDPSGTTYTIVLSNDPPMIGAASHEELDLYYRVLQDSSRRLIGLSQRYRLTVSPSGPTTDEVPCMPVTLLP